MGRWTQYDEDEYRMPEGMKRIGYDSDSGRYYFQDKNDGTIWKGEEGSEFGGQLRQVAEPPSHIGVNIGGEGDNDDEDLANSGTTRSDGYTSLATNVPSPRKENAYRYLFPWFLIVMVFLLLVYRFIVMPGNSSNDNNPAVLHCPENTSTYKIHSGDTCWGISDKAGCSVEELMSSNNGHEDVKPLVCDNLQVGQTICVPMAKDTLV